LGTNGRSSCSFHSPSGGISVSVLNVQLRFLFTLDHDPIFRTVDDSNGNHNIHVSNFPGMLSAYKLLLTRGLATFPIVNQS